MAPHLPPNSIAITGMACRFPDAATPQAFWENLKNGLHSLKELSPKDLEESGVAPQRWQAPNYVRRAMLLEGVEQFDAAFFDISAGEARLIDPQQRLLLECSWEALEQAGYPPGAPATQQTRPSVGVYMGCRVSEYLLLYHPTPDVFGIIDDAPEAGFQRLIANDKDYIATRISYKLDLHGPSLSVQTACSTSLVAVHLACQSLLSHECDLALAGGASIRVPPRAGYLYSEGMIFSPDGYTRSFDADAQGTIFSSGAGVVALKRLEDAWRDGDPIFAVIRGSAVNNDGAQGKATFTAPSAAGQARVIAEALAVAEVLPETVSYVEAHGTATRLGDPIEVSALMDVFGGRPRQGQTCALGSVKSNLGHLVQAAGVAGLIKTALMLQHKTLVPSLHFTRPNPRIAFDDSPFYVNTETRPWLEGATPRRAGVSAFGFGGTNAHVVLEEAPARPAAGPPPPACLLTLSAHTSQALKDLAQSTASALQAGSISLRDAALTSQLRRAHFAQRLSIAGEDAAGISAQLTAFATGKRAARIISGSTGDTPRIAFLFTGQGSQYVQMGRQLYESQPVFRQALERCQEILRPLLPAPLLQVLYPAEGIESPLEQTRYTQPALFALQYALAQTWMAWGVLPEAVAGHSLGEYTAACIAGALSLEDGLRLAVRRGEIMDAVHQPGAMATIYAPIEKVEETLLLHLGVNIATHNGPENTVISGTSAAVEAACRAFETGGIGIQRMKGSYAFHSPLIEPALPGLEEASRQVQMRPLAIPFISTLSGQPAGLETLADPGYWSRQTRQSVLFLEAMRSLAGLGYNTFIEIGPNPVLVTLGRSCLPGEKYAWLPSLRSKLGDLEQMLASLGSLYTLGYPLDWQAFWATQPETGRGALLPTYPFQRQRHWLGKIVAGGSREAADPSTRTERADEQPLLGRRIASPLQQRLYQQELRAEDFPFLAQHIIYDQNLMPATGFVEMAHAAARQALGASQVGEVRLVELVIQRPLLFTPGTARSVQVVVTPQGTVSGGWHPAVQVQIYSLEHGEEERWQLHVEARLEYIPAEQPEMPQLEFGRLEAMQEVSRQEFYDILRQRGNGAGEAMQGVRRLSCLPGEALGLISLPFQPAEKDLLLNPALLDGCLQVAVGAQWQQARQEQAAYLPLVWQNMRFFAPLEGEIWCHARALPGETPDVRVFNLKLYSSEGRPLGEVGALHVKRAARASLASETAGLPGDWLYQMTWEVAPPLEAAAEGPGNWLLVSQGTDLAEAVAAALEGAGDRCILAQPGKAWEMHSENSISFNLHEKQDLLRLLQEQQASGAAPLRGVLHLLAAEQPRSGDSLEALKLYQERLCGSALAVIQALLEQPAATQPSRRSGGPRLFLVTRGAQATGLETGPLSPDGAPLWGLGRALMQENDALPCSLIDLDPALAANDPGGLPGLLLGNGRSAPLGATPLGATPLGATPPGATLSGTTLRQSALRGRQIYWPRLERIQTDGGPMGGPMGGLMGRAVELQVGQTGKLDSLAWRPQSVQPPGPGEIQIQVRAVGMNFRDILTALGQVSGKMGFEASGIVTALGEGVTAFKPGEAVMAITQNAYASFANIPAQQAALKPGWLSFEQAASLPLVFATVLYGLEILAKLQPGEKVLIHSAAGGVGLAAIQVAHNAGAEIFATASKPKWELLRSLGVQHIYDSRSPDFDRQLLQDSQGSGVDVVLNTLAGEFIAPTLAVLKTGGRFVELGVLNVLDEQQATARRPDMSFYKFRLTGALEKSPQLAAELLGRLAKGLEARRLRPLPLRIFAHSRVIEAFQSMAQGRHIGKLVLSLPAGRAANETQPELRPDTLYLVTGGLGGLGLQAAEWLVGRGARRLALVSRKAPDSAAQARLDALAESGAHLQVENLDISDPHAVRALLERLAAQGAPLGGILHAAGVLDDGPVARMDWPSFKKVLAPKLYGGWLLDRLTKDLALDFFACFSSTAALLGNAGQSNYAAANAWLDSWAQARRQSGLPALSVNWGLWAGAGMNEQLPEAVQRLREQQGLGKIEPQGGFQALGWALNQPLAQLGVTVIDWERYLRRFAAGGVPPELQKMVPSQAIQTSAQAGEAVFAAQWQAAAPEMRPGLLENRLQKIAAELLGLEASAIDLQTPLRQYGLDSLSALLMRNRVMNDLPECAISVARFMEGPAIQALSGLILESLGAAAPVAAPQPARAAQEWEEGVF